MQTANPFELILSKLDQLQTTVNNLADNTHKPDGARKADPERLLDLSEAAEIVRRPIGTVRYYIHNRNLPATKVGKGYLIKLSELLQWFDEFRKKQSTGKDLLGPMMQNRKKYRKS
jgi:excisionase family DNA binding protein